MPERNSTFPLTQYFIITSFVTIGVVVTITALLSAREIRNDLLERAREHALQVIQHLQKDIRDQFIEPVLAREGTIDLADEEQYAVLDSVTRKIAESFGIRDIYIFDRDGTIIYATVREHVGFAVSDSNELFRHALDGEVSSAVRDRGSPLDLGDDGARTALLETYVPVASLANGPEAGGAIANVIETYQDIDHLQAEVADAQLRIVGVASGGAIALFLVLIWIVTRAHRVMRGQTKELVDGNRRLVQLSRDLEDEVERRTQELIQKEKLASIGTLAAGLAHEVNNPLATIASCAEGLKRRVAAGEGAHPGSDFAHYLDLIEGEAFRVKRITQSLLDFSRQRPSEGREVADIGALLDETLELLRVGDEIEGVEVTVEPPAHPVTFPVDPSELRQLIFNLTRNAADAVRERIERSPEPEGRVRWTIAEDDSGLTLGCEDNGTGFDPDRAGELLEPFFTTKAPGRGTGLGLALCHGIVERHGGRLTIRSEGLDRGAEVRIFLPREQSDGNRP